MNRQKEEAWREAQRRCGLSDEEVRMAKELGFRPKSLVKNIPAPSQRWKQPVKEWVRSLYEKKIGPRAPVSGAPAPQPSPLPASLQGEERRNGEHPWPDDPEIHDLPPLYIDADDPDDDYDSFEPPDAAEIEEQEGLLLRRQRLFRWAAQATAVALSEVPQVEKVAAFGSVAQPLEREVPRFREFRRHRIEILHECADLDLAIWVNDLSRLRDIKSAMARGLALTQNTAYGGVAHHQVDVHVLDSSTGEYRGALCIFRQCPKQGKRECLVPGCGAQPFLQRFERYRFKPALFYGEPKVILFDRAAGFLVPLPNLDAKPRVVNFTSKRTKDNFTDIDDHDLPF